MRLLILMFFLSFLISCEKKCNDQKLTLNISLISRNDNAFRYRRIYWDTMMYKTYPIKITITNKSHEQVTFGLMSCSWWEDFIINNDYTFLPGGDCDANAFIKHQLNPSDSLVLKTLIFSYADSGFHWVKTTKLGLFFIDSLSFSEYPYIIKDKSRWNKIIWSNPLYLK